MERAYDAGRALEIAADSRPDAILRDVEFGEERDGMAPARALRTLRKSEAPTPVRIAISGHSEELLGDDAGLFDRFARKPVELDLLLPWLRRKG